MASARRACGRAARGRDRRRSRSSLPRPWPSQSHPCWSQSRRKSRRSLVRPLPAEPPAPHDAVPLQSTPVASSATVAVSMGDDVPADRLLGAIESVKGALTGRPGPLPVVLSLSVAGAIRQVRLPDKVAWDDRLAERSAAPPGYRSRSSSAPPPRTAPPDPQPSAKRRVWSMSSIARTARSCSKRPATEEGVDLDPSVREAGRAELPPSVGAVGVPPEVEHCGLATDDAVRVAARPSGDRVGHRRSAFGPGSDHDRCLAGRHIGFGNRTRVVEGQALLTGLDLVADEVGQDLVVVPGPSRRRKRRARYPGPRG